MLQRTKAEQVVPVYNVFTRRYRTPSDVIQAPEEEVLELLRPLGLFWRSRAMISMIHELHGRENIPTRIEDLLELLGVGPYAAAAMASFHLGKRAIIVDNNVVRLYSRYFGFKADDQTRRSKKFLMFANRVTPINGFKEFNYALLDHTRALCKPKPLCPHCPLKGNCVFKKQNKLQSYPSLQMSAI